MTDSAPTGKTANTDSEFDPETAAAREGVAFAERTYVHEDTDHCEADAAGRVVVGVTNDRDEALLLVDHERQIAILPNAILDTEESWRGAARRAVADATGLEAAIGDPICVREVQHTTEDSDLTHNESWHVVFEASIRGLDAEPQTPEDGPFEAGWFETLPVELPEESPGHGDVLGDVGAVLP